MINGRKIGVETASYIDEEIGGYRKRICKREIEKERESVLFLIYCIWQDFLCLLSKVSYVAADRYIIV